jgi:predicted metal-dependent enzyme (double-stranded beta helix superfamily)
MKQLNLYEENDFSEKAFKKLLVHDSPYFKILNFNFKPGQELPVHNHDIEGQLSLVIQNPVMWSSVKLPNLTACVPKPI